MPESNSHRRSSASAERRRLSMMLTGLAMAFRLCYWINPAFRQHLKANDWVLQVRTADGRVCRHFAVRKGRFSSGARAHAKPDFEQVWAQAGDAVYALTHPDRSELLRANETGLVQFHGDALVAIVFTEALETLRLGFRKPVRRIGVRA